MIKNFDDMENADWASESFTMDEIYAKGLDGDDAYTFLKKEKNGLGVSFFTEILEHPNYFTFYKGII